MANTILSAAAIAILGLAATGAAQAASFSDPRLRVAADPAIVDPLAVLGFGPAGAVDLLDVIAFGAVDSDPTGPVFDIFGAIAFDGATGDLVVDATAELTAFSDAPGDAGSFLNAVDLRAGADTIEILLELDGGDFVGAFGDLAVLTIGLALDPTSTDGAIAQLAAGNASFQGGAAFNGATIVPVPAALPLFVTAIAAVAFAARGRPRA